MLKPLLDLGYTNANDRLNATYFGGMMPVTYMH